MIEALEKSKKPMTVPEADFSAVNEWVQLDGRDYVVIRGLESLDPFFLSLVSASEQWFFCSSNGSLSAGRRSPDTALFPYLTVDKILDNWNCSGALTAISCEGHLWHPFWPVATHFAPVKRRLLKSLLGEELIFEERHDALGLVFSYRWQLSDEFGFVRKVELINEGDETRSLRMIDGLQDLLPSGVNHGLHLELSCLADAYKMSELVCGGALMIHRLASGIVDAPIPLECLKVTTVWTSGFEGGHTFLSRTEAENYLKRGQVTGGQKSRGQRGAFLLGGEMTLAAGESRKWTMVAEIEQSHQAVAKLATQLEDPVSLLAAVENDLRKERERLYALVASVDGFQVTADRDVAHYHYYNTLCNYLRGGLPEDHAKLGRESFIHYLAQNNRPLLEKHQDALESLPVSVQRADLIDWAAQQGSPDLLRLAEEYLPLILARRHGDPSRPWNKFHIRLKDEKGDPVHHFEGNWRDIFQNWEALAWTYPVFLDGFINKFLNASTRDGFNPYRVTSSGVDWEVPDEDDPWVSIGYWGDHQIVYLLKFLELKEKMQPGYFQAEFEDARYVFSDVPYRFKKWEEILRDPRNTIDFDSEKHESLMALKEKMGGDALLLRDQSGEPVKVNLIEKLLIPAAIKLGQLVPGGGVWMNTQKPEWNDANNALAGSGLSVVTSSYLLRYLSLIERILTKVPAKELQISQALARLLETLAELLKAEQERKEDLSDHARFRWVSAAGRGLQDYREAESRALQRFATEKALSFVQSAKAALERVLASNRRADGLWHSYNILEIRESEEAMGIRHLPVMLEGQVAVLSSGFLSSNETVNILELLEKSELRSQRHPTYLLYPDRELASFMEMNLLSESSVMNVPILKKMGEVGDTRLVLQDAQGCWRFRESLVNSYALADALEAVEELPPEERRQIEKLYEEVFCHQSFTGRSGSMFGYEGLACVYWHMVSKLLLAAQEVVKGAFDSEAHIDFKKRAVAAYYSVQRGLGFRQTPAQYGAFPSEPYSHSQGQRGAQQPGLTGQVKEGILCRLAELGLDFKEGCLSFRPRFLRRAEFAEGDLSFTYARCAVSYQMVSDLEEAQASVHLSQGEIRKFEGAILDLETSSQLAFQEGIIQKVEVQIPAHWLIESALNS